MVRVAFQGERGAFSEDALITFFGDAELSPGRYLGDVFEAVLEDRVDFGVVPVENSQAGSINDIYDLLLSKLEQKTNFVKILGSYPRAEN